MKIKAYWRSDNPFLPRIEDLAYTKTVEVPEDSDMDELIAFAKADSKKNYHFEKIEKLDA